MYVEDVFNILFKMIGFVYFGYYVNNFTFYNRKVFALLFIHTIYYCMSSNNTINDITNNNYFLYNVVYYYYY